QQAALGPALVASFQKWPRPGGPVFLGYVVAAVDPTLAGDPRVAARLRPWEWTKELARVGYAPAIAEARSRGRSGDASDRKAFAAVADVISEARDAERLAKDLASTPHF